jgi:hypothetical protein
MHEGVTETVHSAANKYEIRVVPLYEAFNGPDGNEKSGEKGYLSDGVMRTGSTSLGGSRTMSLENPAQTT